MGILQTEKEKRETMWMVARFPFPKDVFMLNKNRVIPSNPEDYIDGDNENILHFKDFDVYNDILKKRKCLEIGSGSGKTLFHLATTGKGMYYGLEPEEEAYNYIISKNWDTRAKNIKVFKKRIEEVTFKKNEFDYIFSHDVFEHLENPLIMIKKAREWLKTKGKLIIACPNVEGFIPRFYGIGSWRMTFPTHVWLPGRSILFRLLEENGFEIEKHFTYGGYPAPRNFIKEIANKLFRKFNLGDRMVILARKI